MLYKLLLGRPNACQAHRQNFICYASLPPIVKECVLHTEFIRHTLPCNTFDPHQPPMMKNVFLTLLGLALGTAAMAQNIPNASFENWSSFTTANGNTYMQPTYWRTYNGSLAQSNSPIRTTLKDSVGAVAGTYYARLQSRKVTLNGTSGVVPGILQAISNVGANAKVGFPYMSRPRNLYLQCRFIIPDSTVPPVISVALTKWNTAANRRDTVASFYGVINNQGIQQNFAALYAPLQYAAAPIGALTPDSARIFISSGNGNDSIQGLGNQLDVDNVFFNTFPTGVDDVVLKPSNGQASLAQANAPAFSVYPNPVANGAASLRFAAAVPANTRIDVLDAAGRTLRTARLPEHATTYTLNTTGLAPGLYMVRTQGAGKPSTATLVIE